MCTRQEQLNAAQTKNELLVVARPFLIEQNWTAYSADQHATWSELVRRCMPQLRQYACQEYLDGFEQIGLREDSIPDLAAVSSKLEPRTGWNSTPVSGYLPADAFFEMLAARRFPTTITLRDRSSLECWSTSFPSPRCSQCCMRSNPSSKSMKRRRKRNGAWAKRFIESQTL